MRPWLHGAVLFLAALGAACGTTDSDEHSDGGTGGASSDGGSLVLKQCAYVGSSGDPEWPFAYRCPSQVVDPDCTAPILERVQYHPVKRAFRELGDTRELQLQERLRFIIASRNCTLPNVSDRWWRRRRGRWALLRLLRRNRRSNGCGACYCRRRSATNGDQYQPGSSF